MVLSVFDFDGGSESLELQILIFCARNGIWGGEFPQSIEKHGYHVPGFGAIALWIFRWICLVPIPCLNVFILCALVLALLFPNPEQGYFD